ncbi:MAG: UvrD-helicase domain-containing protein [Clostridiales bacterium]|nr:UvrD-helicase domain-containing protein [Clostridiales bacterium]
MPFTPEQQAAIAARGNILVSAGAGAGKTSTLTERVLTHILHGAALSEILVMTFTKAAASEMKSRIAKRLEDAFAVEQDRDKKETLRAQADAVVAADISTFHGFCAKLTARHFAACGLSPTARVADETQSAVLLQKTLDELLTRLASEDAPQFRTLIAAFNGERKLREQLLSLLAFTESLPDRETWLSTQSSILADTQTRDAVMLQFYTAQTQALIHGIERAKRLAAAEFDMKMCAYLDDILSQTRAVALCGNIRDFVHVLCALDFGRIPVNRERTAALKEACASARDRLKDYINGSVRRLQSGLDGEAQSAELFAQSAAALISATAKLLELYTEKKREADILDFSDLERYALEILRRPEICREYRERYREVIVDEFQDTNDVQEAILQKIARPDNLFLVGDVKQSIYAFRGANPGLFLRREEDYSRDPVSGQTIYLNRNFRSGAAVINAVNRAFAEWMTEPPYDENAALVQGREDAPAGCCELHIFDTGETAEEDAAQSGTEREAAFAAQTILDLMAAGAYENYSDFVVLMRTARHIPVWLRVLARYSIPGFAQSAGGYFDAPEVAVVLSFLRILDNIRQDIPLLAVLRSGYGGFSDEYLIAIRAENRGEDKREHFHACFLRAAETDGKARRFLAMLDGYRAQARSGDTAALITRLLDDFYFYDAIGAQDSGAQRQANLEALLEKARAFDAGGGFGVHGLLEFMDNAKSSAREGAAPLAAGNAVRLMTVHKSKGLEFPVVFLADLAGQFNTQDQRRDVKPHREYGLGLRITDHAAQTLRRNAEDSFIAAAAAQKQVTEETRLLYVAMTRARERLYLLGGLKNAAEELKKEEAAPNPLAGGDWLSWLRHSLRGYVPMHAHTDAPVLPRASVYRRDNESTTADTAALAAHLSWVYPHATETAQRGKLSVSALAQTEFEELEPLSFDTDKPDARVLGINLHAFLESLPPHPHTIEELRAIAPPTLTPAQLRMAAWWSNTPLYARFCAAARRHRELPFVCAFTPLELYGSGTTDEPSLRGAALPEEAQRRGNPLLQSAEPTLLQGIIDACFLEDGNWILIDYKSDRVTTTPRESAERHKHQIELYAAALARVTGIPVTERYIVLLSAGVCVEV